MIVRRVLDKKLIKDVAGLDWDNITSDADPDFDQFDPDIDGVEYYGGFVGGSVVGVVALRDYAEYTACHIITVPDKRWHALQLAKRALKHAKLPVQTNIPETHENVIRFAEHLGFIKAQTQQGAWVKNGSKYDLYIMRLE